MGGSATGAVDCLRSVGASAVPVTLPRVAHTTLVFRGGLQLDCAYRWRWMTGGVAAARSGECSADSIPNIQMRLVGSPRLALNHLGRGTVL